MSPRQPPTLLIHLSTRRVVLAAVTANPDSAWVTQQARNVAMDLNDQAATIRFVLRDHDTKFCRSFDEVFCSEGAEVIRTPIQAPRANAYAERWVQTVPIRPPEVRRRDVLSGLIHEYHRVAA